MSSARLGRYSLAGPENRAAVDAGLANGAWYRIADPAQADEGADAALRRARPSATRRSGSA